MRALTFFCQGNTVHLETLEPHSLLLSAVGITHVLRSVLVMGYAQKKIMDRIDYTQRSTRLAMKLSVSPPVYPWVTATLFLE